MSADCWKRIGTWGDRTCGELVAQVHCRNCPVYTSQAARLLDAEIPAGYLAEHARHYAQQKAAAKAGTRSVVIFRIAREWLALPTGVFREIAPLRPVHSLPHRRDNVVTGVVNVRGELIVSVSLAATLGIGAEPGSGAAARLAVVSRGTDRFAFAADEIAAVQRFDDSDLAALPATLAHARSVYTRGTLAWRQEAVGVLDDELLFYSLTRSLA
jgi:chemotaxis-related protein WspD